MFTVDLRSGERRLLLEQQTRGAWYAGRQTLIYVLADGSLWAVPFDPDRGVVTGPTAALGGPASSMPTGTARVSECSRTGTVVFVPRVGATPVLVDRQGVATPLIDRAGEYHNPRFSGDGTRVAMDIIEPTGRDVWVLDRGQGTLTRATFDNDGHDAIWSPDGVTLTYLATREAGVATLLARRDGTAPRMLASGMTPGDWLPDGRLVATLFIGGSGQYDIITVDSVGIPEPLVATSFAEAFPAISHDGRWIAYVSDESRQHQVYVRRVDGMGARVQVSVAGGAEPRWGPAGELFFIATGGAAPVSTSAHLSRQLTRGFSSGPYSSTPAPMRGRNPTPTTTCPGTGARSPSSVAPRAPEWSSSKTSNSSSLRRAGRAPGRSLQFPPARVGSPASIPTGPHLGEHTDDVASSTTVDPAVERKPRDDEIDVFGLTHAGRVRANNQDHFLISSLRRQVQILRTSRTIPGGPPRNAWPSSRWSPTASAGAPRVRRPAAWRWRGSQSTWHRA